MRLKGRVVIVTGAGSGLGRAGALAFGREGARVVASDLDAGAGETTAAEVRDAGGEAIAIPADAGDRAQARHLVDDMPRRAMHDARSRERGRGPQR